MNTENELKELRDVAWNVYTAALETRNCAIRDADDAWDFYINANDACKEAK